MAYSGLHSRSLFSPRKNARSGSRAREIASETLSEANGMLITGPCLGERSQAYEEESTGTGILAWA